MGWKTWLGLEPDEAKTVVQPKMLFALPKEVARELKGFEYRRAFECSACETDKKTQISIRSREDRMDGPSNFLPYPVGHKLAGHSQVESGQLTWNGLLEERGWDSDPVRCPACKAGMSLADYKAARRK